MADLPRANPDTYTGTVDIELARFDDQSAFDIDALLHDIDLALSTNAALQNVTSERQVIDAMLSQIETGSGPFGKYFDELNQEFGSSGRAIEVSNQVMEGVQFDDTLPDTFKLAQKVPQVWITTGVSVCPQCIVRHGQVETLERWKELGLPGNFPSYCGENCKCNLEPVSTLREKGTTLNDIRRPVTSFQKSVNAKGETVTGLKIKKLSGVISGRGFDKMEAAFKQIERDGVKIMNPATIEARRSLQALGNFNK